jgi:Asp-tRNA(Asn)/Glu-tRNA(Gln) amidotransferase A subunit family amidase
MKGGLRDVFETADFLICPAATGPAPEGLEFTGDSIFNGLWTFCGTPAVTVPIEVAENGLPIGVQIVAAKGRDADLLRVAQWLYDWNAAGRG